MVAGHDSQILRFGPFELDPAGHRLTRDGQFVPLPPKAFELLVILAASDGRTVPKQELISFLWPDSVVEESNLTQTVFLARKAVGADAILSVPRVGYRFGHPVTRGEQPPAPLWSRLLGAWR